METDRRTRYLPTLQPDDPASLPDASFARAFVPLRPDRRGRPRGAAWIRMLAGRGDVWGHFCLPDSTLRRLERIDPLGLGLARRAGVRGIVSMDVPLYGFFSDGQRERAHARALHRIHRTVELAPREGLGVIPLVKALDLPTVDARLDLVHDLGLRAAAFYARELLLEHEGDVLRRFVRGAHRRGIRPILMGACSPRWMQWGSADLTSSHHYVLARRHEALERSGRRRRMAGPSLSWRTQRFIGPQDLRGTCTHNFLTIRDRITRADATLRLGA